MKLLGVTCRVIQSLQVEGWKKALVLCAIKGSRNSCKGQQGRPGGFGCPGGVASTVFLVAARLYWHYKKSDFSISIVNKRLDL